MENQQSERYEKHRYEINVLDCANEVIKNLRNAQHPDLLKISIEEYESRLNEAVLEYKRSINFERYLSETERRQAFVISITHPSFNFWLALHLSTEDPFEIPLLLDAYFEEEFGYLENFIGQVQFFVLKIIKHNVFSDCDNQKQAVTNWLREKKKEIRNQKSDKNKFNNIEIGELNIKLNEFNDNRNVIIENKLENYFQIISIQNNFNSTNIFYPDHHEMGKESDSIFKPKQEESFIIDNPIDLIPITLEYHITLDYFLQLEKFVVNSKEPKSEIEYLVKSNFNFRNVTAVYPKKQLNISLQKQHLRYFVYKFYKDIDFDHYDFKAEYYCKFLIDNFLLFETNKLENLKKNFSRFYTGKYPFKS
jgi:hypothetical protein